MQKILTEATNINEKVTEVIILHQYANLPDVQAGA
jgi:hypothetical protein